MSSHLRMFTDGHVMRLFYRSLLPIVVRALTALASIALLFFLSSRLGADAAGGFLWCVALIAMLATVGRVGLDNVIVRRVAVLGGGEQPAESLADIAVAAGMISFPPVALSMLVLIAVPELVAGLSDHPGLIVDAMPAFALALFFNVAALLAARLLVGRQRPVAGLFVEGVLLPALFMLMLWPQARLGLVPAAWSYALASLLVFLLALLLLGRERGALVLASPGRTAREMLRSGLPLWMAMIMADATVWGGQLIIGMMSGAREVALLAVAQRIASSVTLILQAVRAVVAPRFAAQYAAGTLEALRRTTAASSAVNLLVAAPMLAIVLLFPDPILGFFGRDFAGAKSALIILALGQMVNAAVGNYGALLAMTGHEVQLRNITIVTGVFTLLLLPLGIHAAGLPGAAVIIASSVALQNLLALWFGRKHILRNDVKAAGQ